MVFYYSDDPVRDAERVMEAQERQMDHLPRCVHCGYPIQSEYLFRIGGDSVCPVCLEDYYRAPTRDFIA